MYNNRTEQDVNDTDLTFLKRRKIKKKTNIKSTLMFSGETPAFKQAASRSNYDIWLTP